MAGECVAVFSHHSNVSIDGLQSFNMELDDAEKLLKDRVSEYEKIQGIYLYQYVGIGPGIGMLYFYHAICPI